jgi:hypothetical protein
MNGADAGPGSFEDPTFLRLNPCRALDGAIVTD